MQQNTNIVICSKNLVKLKKTFYKVYFNFQAIEGIDIGSEGIKLRGDFEITCKDGNTTTSVST